MLINWHVPTYEYVGFIYLVKNGKLTPAPDQHRAAYKEKHRMTAQKVYDKENK